MEEKILSNTPFFGSEKYNGFGGLLNKSETYIMLNSSNLIKVRCVANEKKIFHGIYSYIVKYFTRRVWQG